MAPDRSTRTFPKLAAEAGLPPVRRHDLRHGAVRVSRQSVYSWKARHASAGVDGLREVSRRPRTSPSRLAAETEALVCELRRARPRWSARRIAFEVAQRGTESSPSRVGAGIAHLLKGSLDGAVAEVEPVLALPPGMRVATVTAYTDRLRRRLEHPTV